MIKTECANLLFSRSRNCIQTWYQKASIVSQTSIGQFDQSLLPSESQYAIAICYVNTSSAIVGLRDRKRGLRSRV